MLTTLQRARLVKWLESMPWWRELPYVQLEAEIVGLRERDKFLSALEQAGVDNWNGYSFAFDILKEKQENR